MRTHYRTSFAILAANLTSLYIPGSPDEAWPTAGREPWPDDTTPRTDRPVRFVYVHRAGWYAGRGAVLGMVGTLWTHLRHS